MVIKLQRSWEANTLRPSHAEITLMKCLREVIAEGLAMCEANRTTKPVTGGRGSANNNISVAEWISTLESIGRDQQRSGPSEEVVNATSILSRHETQAVMASATSAPSPMQECEAFKAVGDGFEDDLDTDLAKAALETGAAAFEAQKWEEAECLLQEALQVLEQLPKQQRVFCDIFTLYYRLSVCTFHTRAPEDAKEALLCLIQQQASSDEHRGYVLDARHLLACLYIRLGQIDRAKSECDKALHARRMLFGKYSDASLQSTALMAYICVLLNNPVRAKAYRAMIPPESRDAILKIVEDSLGMKMEPLDSSLITNSPQSTYSDLSGGRIYSQLSISSPTPPMESRHNDPISFMTSQSSAVGLQQPASFQQSYQREYSDSSPLPIQPIAGVQQELRAAALNPGESPEKTDTFKDKPLSRKEILDNIGCQPQNRIEKAVCRGDRSALDDLLQSKKKFWRIKFHTNNAPERITALHFAALFGEINIAQRLLISGFNINEVPFGYSTRHTPIKFAIGARQVDMVRFLVANGAKPSKPDSWSTMASQLMNHSWLKMTMSDPEQQYLPSRIVAILNILVKQGWNVNEPFEVSGNTVLHQAVTFWTGSLRLDLELRTEVASFLCSQGADPFRANAEGKTPYDIAAASDDKLLLVLRQCRNVQERGNGAVNAVELPGHSITKR
jgi:tetratricopeptide (TPR) repeat protein